MPLSVMIVPHRDNRTAIAAGLGLRNSMPNPFQRPATEKLPPLRRHFPQCQIPDYSGFCIRIEDLLLDTPYRRITGTIQV